MSNGRLTSGNDKAVGQEQTQTDRVFPIMAYEFKSLYFDNPITPDRCMDILPPDSGSRRKALFFVHGGGWTGGTRGRLHLLMRTFNKEGYVCAATDYRLCVPGISAFDQLTDIRHGYLLFVEALKAMGNPIEIVVFGSSAGAHLAALLALAAPGQCGEVLEYGDMGIDAWIPPAAAILQATPVLFEPWEDIFPPIWSAMQKAAGVSYDEQPEVYRRLAPSTYLSETACPVFFMEAECEHMFPMRYNLEFVEKAQALGRRAEYKVYANAEHGFFYDVTRRVQKEAFLDCLRFIESLPEGSNLPSASSD